MMIADSSRIYNDVAMACHKGPNSHAKEIVKGINLKKTNLNLSIKQYQRNMREFKGPSSQ